MIKKEDIKKYLNERGTSWATRHRDIDLIHDCITELSQDEWVSARNGDDIKDNQLCWVLMPDGEIHTMRFNNYIKYGGIENYWQDLEGNDYSLFETKYIVINQPELPNDK